MIKYTWQHTEDFPVYEVQPAGPYFFKVMHAEPTLQQGSGVTAGSQVIVTRLAIANKQGEIVNQFKQRFILHPRTAWFWQSFLKSINFRGGAIQTGQEVEMELRDIVGGRGRAEIGVKEITPTRSAGSSVYVGSDQQPQEVKIINEAVRFYDNLGLEFDKKVRAEFDERMRQMEISAQSATAQNNSFYPPSNQAPPPSQSKQTAQPQKSPFPKPQQSGAQAETGYPQPDLPSDEECPF